MSKSHNLSVYGCFVAWALSLATAWVACVGTTTAQLSGDDIHTLMTRQKDGADPHEIVVAISGVERSLLKGAEGTKLPGMLQIIDLAASVYRTHDTTVPTDGSVGRWPDFDATKFGGKPIFAGADPQSITDPKIKAAYEQALTSQDQLLTRVSEEMHKLEEGDYCARAALRVLESSANQATLREAVSKHIATIRDAQWIKDRIGQIVLPKPQSIEKPAAKANTNALDHQQEQPHSDEPIPLPTLAKAPTPKKDTTSTQMSSTPNEEPISSTPLSVIVILIPAVSGLLWWLLKKRP